MNEVLNIGVEQPWASLRTPTYSVVLLLTIMCAFSSLITKMSHFQFKVRFSQLVLTWQKSRGLLWLSGSLAVCLEQDVIVATWNRAGVNKFKLDQVDGLHHHHQSTRNNFICHKIWHNYHSNQTRCFGGTSGLCGLFLSICNTCITGHKSSYLLGF